MIKPYLQLIRIPAGFSAISNVLAATIIATDGHPEPAALAITLLASLCLYFGGMALNDCMDLAEDRRLRADRPLVRGQISPRTAWQVAIGLLVCGVLLPAFISFQAWLFAALLAVLIILYDSKTLPSSLHIWSMAACRYAHWLFIFACAGVQSLEFWLWPLPLLFYVAGLTRISEAEAGVGEFAPYRRLAIMLFGLAGFCLLLLTVFLGALIPGVLALGLWSTWLLRLLNTSQEPMNALRVQALVRQLVMGVVAMDACLVTVAGYPVVGALLLLLLLPGRFVGRWISVS